MRKVTVYLLLLFWCVFADNENENGKIQEIDSDSTQQIYKVDKPGTITFTVGAKIKGKVEKPQVMIFLPKQKTQYKEVILDRTFKEDLYEPLPYIPMVN